jgi:hypothetical protein
MKMPFATLYSKLDAHFNQSPDSDIIYIQEINNAPISHSAVDLKHESAVPEPTRKSYSELLEESDDEAEPSITLRCAQPLPKHTRSKNPIQTELTLTLPSNL